MKLKKIASLMLAGVMAVSMLAGCAGKPVDDNKDDDNTGNNTVSYSSMLAQNIDEKVKKDYIHFEDKASDAVALTDALGNLGWVVTNAGATLPMTPVHLNQCLTQNGVACFSGVTSMIDDFEKSIDAENWDLDYCGAKDRLVNYPWVIGEDETMVCGLVYVVDGTVDIKKAMAHVGDDVEALLKDVKNTNNCQDCCPTTVYNYDYTVSASVVNKPVDVIDWYHGSANFIAVTITRVPTAA